MRRFTCFPLQRCASAVTRGSRVHGRTRQRGVAVVTALLLTTLAITIVASLFWQQQVQVRSIENQRLQLQKQWILRGLLDFGLLILKEDAKHSANPPTDDLTEPWSVPILDTPLDQYVENGRTDTESSEASVSASIIDGQSRFNLKNLCPTGACPSQKEVDAFGRLLTNLHLDPALAQAAAGYMASAQQKTTTSPNPGSPAPTPTPSPSPSASSIENSSKLMNITYVDDLMAVPGFTPEIMAQLKEFVIVLKEPTKVNVNTASAEVISAKSPNGELSLPDALALVAARERKHFSTMEEFKQASKITSPVEPEYSIATQYFLANGKVHLSRAMMEMQSLIFRESGTKATVIWIRES